MIIAQAAIIDGLKFKKLGSFNENLQISRAIYFTS
jgi:hypothetical protein